MRKTRGVGCGPSGSARVIPAARAPGLKPLETAAATAAPLAPGHLFPRNTPVWVCFPEGTIGPERDPQPGWYRGPAANGKHHVGNKSSLTAKGAGWTVEGYRILGRVVK